MFNLSVFPFEIISILFSSHLRILIFDILLNIFDSKSLKGSDLKKELNISSGFRSKLEERSLREFNLPPDRLF